MNPQLQILIGDLRQRALQGLEDFDAEWRASGIPRALELHGEAVLRANVRYHAASDLENVLCGRCPVEDVMRELVCASAPMGSAFPPSRLSGVARSIMQEEARAILELLKDSERPGH